MASYTCGPLRGGSTVALVTFLVALTTWRVIEFVLSFLLVNTLRLQKAVTDLADLGVPIQCHTMVHTMTVTTHIQPEVSLPNAYVPAFMLNMLTIVHPTHTYQTAWSLAKCSRATALVKFQLT